VVEGALPAVSPHGKPTHGIYVQGEPDMLVRFAHCCNPVPGDDIVGYITRGRGVTVHKADCVNALHSEPERAIPVSWADDGSGDFSANIQIICYDHPSLLGEITVFVDEMKMPISAVSVKINKNKTCSIMMNVKVQSRTQLDNALKKLQKRSDVIEAYRSAN
jgi:GTP diphosphokinase / guanosine-3',5'-bis(diphosphate) 3'-diphosphatase